MVPLRTIWVRFQAGMCQKWQPVSDTALKCGLGGLGNNMEQPLATWSLRMSPCFFVPAKWMIRFVIWLLFLEWNSEIAQVVSPLRPTGSSENSEVSWIIWIHLALLLSVTSFAASVTSVARLLSGQDERSDAKRRRSDAKRRGWGREGSKDNAVIMRAAARRSALGLGAGRFPGIHIVWFYELEKSMGLVWKIGFSKIFQFIILLPIKY